MEAGGIVPAGSSRALRLDPFALPVRFPAIDSGADGFVRQVELHRERVVVRRAVRGIRMRVGVPVADFTGIALRLVPPVGDIPGAVSVLLEHRDEALSVPLMLAEDADDVVAIWRAWGRVLGLPLLVAEADGATREPFPRLGAVEVSEPALRRRRSNAIKSRRPTILMRRKPGIAIVEPLVHAGEREIIARN